MAVGSTKVVQVTNIAPQATKDQMQTLFGYLGKIEDIRLYPTIRDVAVPVQSRICYIKFHDQGCVAVAQHMTNTVFIDRALIVIPYQNGDIPDEQRALELTNNGTVVPGLYPSEPKLPPNVVNAIEGIPPNHVITTMDPKLEANGLPSYPHLPGHLDSRRIEEIRRTLIVANVDTSVSPEQLLDFFSNNNVEIKYLRMCSRDSDAEHYALVELSEQATVVAALLLNGKQLVERPIKLYHSTQAIAKPEAKSNEAAQKEIEEAMSRVKEAHNLISAAIDPMIGMLSKDKRSRSGSRSRKSRSRSRGRSRRSRSRKRSRSRHRRSRSRHRRRSRSRSKRSRSKDRRRNSPSRRRSSSRSRHRSRSRSRRSRSRRSPSRSKERKKRSPRRRSRSRSRSKGSTSRSRRSRSKSKSRSSKSKYSLDKTKDKDRDRRSKDKSDNGKRSDSDRERPEKESSRSEKKSSKEKRSSDKSESKQSDDKGRSASENNDSKEKTMESES
ncbi:PREDICTED: probable splicing factor, arginine/serine-rich 7 [Wasmannia auropunctata]|uniref:probable splicing factor, arginine/serine-rich 7 n=1 Tax=Wasmannia auropunctata TaxID=64793 RepID=UPI0005EEAE11|nr:PREDICTED: probable splicing factor, arginine/serine-rich 7 [Wasmannia auropunctata]XP_011701303.1 PREDICTED: probable splicing factor, arginine/serine-rich 7 [Wasmannia auropunctata]